MKILNLLKKISSLFHSKIPNNISDNEKIVNIVFSPLNFRKDGALKSNAFKCRRGKDDLSVNRLDYTSLDNCKKQGIQLEEAARSKISGKNFFGIALLFAKEIRSIAKDVISIPVKGNDAHAEIRTGYLLEAGEDAPSEYSLMVDELAIKSRIYRDQDNNSPKWIDSNKNLIINLKIED